MGWFHNGIHTVGIMRQYGSSFMHGHPRGFRLKYPLSTDKNQVKHCNNLDKWPQN